MFFLAILATQIFLTTLSHADSSHCQCTPNYITFEHSYCILTQYFLPCNTVPEPMCQCPTNFTATYQRTTRPSATHDHLQCTYRKRNRTIATIRCTNAAERQQHYLDPVTLFNTDRYNGGSPPVTQAERCGCSGVMTPMRVADGRLFCVNPLYFYAKALPCGFAEPAVCQCPATAAAVASAYGYGGTGGYVMTTGGDGDISNVACIAADARNGNARINCVNQELIDDYLNDMLTNTIGKVLQRLNKRRL